MEGMVCADNPRYGRVVVAGLGVSGRAAAEFCAAHLGAGADDGVLGIGQLTIYGGPRNDDALAFVQRLEPLGVKTIFDVQDIEGSYDLAVMSPGIAPGAPMYQSALRTAREVVSEPELAWRCSPERWIGITGTNGKTTTTTLVAHVLQHAGLAAQTCGNIGLACIEAIGNRQPGDHLVAELSSFQLESMPTFAPDVAVLLNITPDHVEWHGTLEAYARAKAGIFANQAPGQFAIVDATAPATRQVACQLAGTGHSVIALGGPQGLGQPWLPQGADACQHAGCAWIDPAGHCLVVRVDGRDHRLAREADLAIKGGHNMQNALAASAAAVVVGADDAAIAQALCSYRPQAHRLEPCGTVAGVSFFDDSKATNTDAAAKALTAFAHQPVIMLLGGHDKMTDLDDLVDACRHACKAVVCYGQARERFARAFDHAAQVRPGQPAPQLFEAPGLSGAFQQAVAVAQPGDVVLLSPACSSFDEFESYAQRGDAFRGMVQALGADGADGADGEQGGDRRP